MRPAILTTALGVLALGSLAVLGRTRTRLRQQVAREAGARGATPSAPQVPLQRWEGEGGNLLVTPRTVNPAIVPADASE